MSDQASKELQFLERLLDIPEFEMAGFRAVALPEGGISISRRGSFRGAWKGCDEGLCWRPSDIAVGTFTVPDVDEALRRMMKIVLISLQIRASVSRGPAVAA